MSRELPTMDFMPPELEELHSTSARFSTKTETERQRVLRLEATKRRLAEQLDAMRRAQGMHGAASPHVSEHLRSKKLHKMENRLEQKRVKLSEMSVVIARLRANINDLRQRREARKQQNTRTKRGIAAKNRVLATLLLEEASESQRCDELHAKVVAARATIDAEAETFAREWKEKTTKLAHDRAMLHSKFQATREKELLEESQQHRRGPATEKDRPRIGNTMSFRAQENFERVKTLEQAFERMMENTDFESIDQLVMLFLDTEQRNFSLYNMINELNREREELEVANRHLSNEIEKSKGQGVTSDIHRQAIFKSIEDRIVGAEKRETQNSQNTSELLVVVEQMKTVLSTIFSKLGCSGGMAHQLVMDGVTESNIMQYLGMIEQRLVAVVASYKLKLGLPFSPTGALDSPLVAGVLSSQKMDLPTINDMDVDPAMDSEATDGEHASSTAGTPLSVAEIRAQHSRHDLRQKAWGARSKIQGGVTSSRLPDVV